MKTALYILVFTTLTATACTERFDRSTCTDGNNIRKRTYTSETEEAKALAVSIEELRKMPKETRAKRTAAIILADYVSLKDSTYHLNISKEEAKKLGIDGDLYDNVAANLEESNKAIRKALKEGYKLALPDIKKEADKYKSRQNNK